MNTRVVKVLRCPKAKCRGAAMAKVVAQSDGQFLHTAGVDRVGDLRGIETTVDDLSNGKFARYAALVAGRTLHWPSSVKHILPEPPVYDPSNLEAFPLDATWPGKTEKVACPRCHGLSRVEVLPNADVVLSS